MKLEQKKELYFEGAKKIIPQIELSQMFYFGDPEKTTSAGIELSVRNELIEPFIETDKTSKFIHYTNIQSFCEIINSKNFRMYNCDNLNDPKEIEYGLKKFGLDLRKDQIENYKRSHFVFSSCKYNEKNLEDFNMWRLYGNYGNGVGIVYNLEFENNNYQSETIYVGNVNYGAVNEKLNRFKKYIQFHNAFNQEHELFKNTPKLFPLISGFFKDDIWSIENESRIFTTCNIDRFGNVSNDIQSNILIKQTLEATINRNGKKVYYMKLPLKSEIISDEKEILNKIFPKIKIHKIVIGYSLTEDAKGELINYINNELTKKLGYHITIENSKIFND